MVGTNWGAGTFPYWAFSRSGSRNRLGINPTSNCIANVRDASESSRICARVFGLVLLIGCGNAAALFTRTPGSHHIATELPKTPLSPHLAQNPHRNSGSQVVHFACPQFAVQLAHKDLFLMRPLVGWKRIAGQYGVGVGTIYRVALEGSKIREKVS